MCRIAKDIVIKAEPIERAWMMINRYALNQRIEPNWDVVTFFIKRPHSEVIVNLIKLKFGERIEGERSTRWKSRMIVITTDKKQVAKERLSHAENNIDGYAFLKHFFRYISHVFPAAERWN